MPKIQMHVSRICTRQVENLAAHITYQEKPSALKPPSSAETALSVLSSEDRGGPKERPLAVAVLVVQRPFKGRPLVV